MKIGVISDSHDNLPMIRRAVELFNGRGDIELVLHAGDFVAPFAMKALLQLNVPLLAVFGNNDGEHVGLSKLAADLADPPVQREIGGRAVCIVHSIEQAAGCEAHADVIVYGHDHQANIGPGPPLKVNPGECCGYLTGRATVAIVDLETLTAEIIELP